MVKPESNKLIEYQSMDNIAEVLDEQLLAKIGEECHRNYMVDADSMQSWLERNKKGMEIALQVTKEKTFPWRNAANVKYPLITNGAITFASREYPQLVRGDTVVEAAVIGNDPDGTRGNIAKRISRYMSYQLLEESPDWEIDTDKMLVMLAVLGTVFRKCYYDPFLNRPVFEVCRPDQVFVNANIKNLEKARRITHIIPMYKNDIISRVRQGLYLDIDITKISNTAPISDNHEFIGNRDHDRPYQIAEQHTFLDLDEDDYAEPYIVTFEVTSHKVLRIKARYDITDDSFQFNKKNEIKWIRPINYFSDYHFLPSPEGKFFSLGYGTLLHPINDSINTLINQLLDAGTLQNAQSGFLAPHCRIKSGELTISPGRWNKLEGAYGEIQNNFALIPTNPPSPVLFNLLSLLIDGGKELASVSEILQGNQPTQNSPASTVLALIKQGLVQYNAIHKRVLRSFKKEFDKLFYLNSLYLDVINYQNVVNDPLASKQDFDLNSFAARPVADPNMASDLQRMSKAQAIMAIPGLNETEQKKQYLEALEAENIEMLLQPSAPPPDAQLIAAKAQTEQIKGQSMLLDHQAKAAELEQSIKDSQQKLALDQAKQILEQKQFLLDFEKMKAEIQNTAADTINKLAQANKAKEEAKHAGDKVKTTGTSS